MKELKSNLQIILLSIVLLILVLPFFQSQLHLFRIKPLKGAITQPKEVQFSLSGWFSGEYQEEKESYLNETFGFRNWFIRINNQLAYTFFNKAKANGVIIGKENYLFEENYIKAYYGIDYVGKDSIMHRMQRLKYIQDTLSRLNKNLIIVFAAGKGSFYPEYFPDEYKTTRDTTNLQIHLEFAKRLHLNFINFNDYFVENKYTSPYPLYPQFGIHWSYYGSCIAADSMIHFIEQLRNIDMPNLYWNKIDKESAHGTDVDIAAGMNLIFNPKSFKMAYPEVLFQDDSGKTKPSVLVIADSYYWEMYNFGISRLFSKSHFWFYNKEIFPESFQSPLTTDQINLKDQIANHDVIIILATEATLPGFGWGFIENTYDLFKGKTVPKVQDDEFQKRVKELIKYIKTDDDWMAVIEKKAAQKNISVDSMLLIDARWQIRQEKK